MGFVIFLSPFLIERVEHEGGNSGWLSDNLSTAPGSPAFHAVGTEGGGKQVTALIRIVGTAEP
jgi:hypothetical protein